LLRLTEILILEVLVKGRNNLASGNNQHLYVVDVVLKEVYFLV